MSGEGGNGIATNSLWASARRSGGKTLHIRGCYMTFPPPTCVGISAASPEASHSLTQQLKNKGEVRIAARKASRRPARCSFGPLRAGTTACRCRSNLENITGPILAEYVPYPSAGSLGVNVHHHGVHSVT